MWAGGAAKGVRCRRRPPPFPSSQLRRLRKPGEAGYRLPPPVGPFALVACPNYLGEMVEWAGFALAAGSAPATAFALFTAANLVPRALAHRRWYVSTFAGYPRGRKAVLPWVL